MRKPRVLSELEITTRLRNDRIRRLRGLYSNAERLLDSSLIPSVKAAVDIQLRRLSAQPEGERRVQEQDARLSGRGYWAGYGKRRHFVEYKNEN